MMLSDMQIEFRDNATHRWNIKTGATRSGKTYLDYFIIPMRLSERMDKPGLVILLGNTRGTLQRNIIEPMQKLYGERFVSGIRSGDNTAVIFGQKCYCLGADSVKHVDRIRGSSIKYAYGDEVTTWNLEVFEMLKSRLDKSYSAFDGTCNPDSPRHWFKKFLDGEADIYQQHYTIDDNPFLPPDFVENLKREYKGTVFYDRYILGLWALAEGLIYQKYEHAMEEPFSGRLMDYTVSMDYGTQNATAMLLWGYDGRVWHAVREFRHSGRDTGQPRTDDEYYADLCAFIGDAPVRRVIVDPSAASFITLIRRRGRFSALPADNDVLNGIRDTASSMNQGLIKVGRNLEAFRAEIEGYVWDDKSGTDQPVKREDHLMDAMRYFVRTMRLSVGKRGSLI